MERPLCDVKRKSSTGQEVGNENRARRRGKRADVRPERNQARKPMVKKGGEQLRFLLDYFLMALPVSERVFSFRPNVSIADNARQHIRRNFVGNTDIENFFGSITQTQVVKHLHANGFDVGSSTLISKLVTKDAVLPQGASTSPIISNSLLFNFDNQVAAICKNNNLVYTRYADDIVVSGDNKGAILVLIDFVKMELLQTYGLRINVEKTRVSSKHGQQKVTGLVVNELGLPSRQFRRRIRAKFHNAKVGTEISQNEINSLSGYLSYLMGFDELRNSAELTRYREILKDLKQAMP